tara:strand:- start:833 stop:946 length:114 start_codon:yes stop_codon:yes gene_type:complete
MHLIVFSRLQDAAAMYMTEEFVTCTLDELLVGQIILL